jgi:uncharacterized RDD family membrane protein YckC
MKLSVRQLFLAAAIACCFTLALAAFAQEEKAPPAPTTVTAAETATVAPATAPTPTTPPAVDAVAPAPSAVTPTATPDAQPERALRRIDTTPAAVPSRSAPARRASPPRLRFNNRNDNSVVSIAHDSWLAKDQEADAVVSVLGSSTSEGSVSDAVVSVLGNTRVTGGRVGDAAVAVLGNTYVNAKIGGEAVAVLGDVELGPDADIGGDVVSVGGTVKRDPKAVVHGHVQSVTVGGGNFPSVHLSGLQRWFRDCAMYGRPLAFTPELGWAWMLALIFFGFYALLALLFPASMTKCVTTLETRPGASVLTAILSILLIPVLIVLLCVTVIGIVAVPFVALGLVLAGLFGKAVMLVWVGRRLTKFFGDGPLNAPVVAVLVGSILVLLLYTVPIVGMVVQKSLDLIGLGVVIYTIIAANKREKPIAPPRPPVVSAAPPVVPVAPIVPVMPPTAPEVPGANFTPSTPVAMPMVSPGFGAAGVVAGDPIATGAPAGSLPPPAPAPMPAFAAPAAPNVPPLISAATGLRAGFMIRSAALLLDFILVGMVLAFMSTGGKIFLLAIASYGAVMWKLKGTTIGGVVCGLKVVRLDDREIDWATAIVRALGCFLSMAVAGLGFLWVAIDDEKQSWHDKIAGTTVVRVPKGVSLL